MSPSVFSVVSFPQVCPLKFLATCVNYKTFHYVMDQIAYVYLASFLISLRSYPCSLCCLQAKDMQNNQKNYCFCILSLEVSEREVFIWVTELRRMIWAEHVPHIGDRRGAYRHLVRMSEGKGLLGIPRHTDGRIILKWIFKKWYGGVRTGLICGKLLWLAMNLMFHMMQENSWLADNLSASQEGLCFVELLSICTIYNVIMLNRQYLCLDIAHTHTLIIKEQILIPALQI